MACKSSQFDKTFGKILSLTFSFQNYVVLSGDTLSFKTYKHILHWQRCNKLLITCKDQYSLSGMIGTCRTRTCYLICCQCFEARMAGLLWYLTGTAPHYLWTHWNIRVLWDMMHFNNITHSSHGLTKCHGPSTLCANNVPYTLLLSMGIHVHIHVQLWLCYSTSCSYSVSNDCNAPRVNDGQF